MEVVKVSKGAKIRNRYNQVPHQTQDTNGKVWKSAKFYVQMAANGHVTIFIISSSNENFIYMQHSVKV